MRLAHSLISRSEVWCGYKPRFYPSCFVFIPRYSLNNCRNKYTYSYPVVRSPKSDGFTLHGRVIRDDYLWLKSLEFSEARKILENENSLTNRFMSDSTGFQSKLVGKFHNLFNQYGRYFEDDQPVSYGNFFYYTKQSETDSNYSKHCRLHRKGSNDEEIILDEANIANDCDHFAVKAMKISPSERYVGFIVDISGYDTYRGIILDTVDKPGLILEQLPCVNLEWSSHDKLLYYTSSDDLHRADKVWSHRIGSDVTYDELIFHEKDARFYLDVSSTKDGRFLTINSSSKSTSEVHLLDSLEANATARVVRPREPGIEYYLEHCDGRFYMLTNYPDGGNYGVFSASEKQLLQSKWKPFVNLSNEVIVDDMDIFSDHLVLYEKKALKPRLTVVPLRNTEDQYTVEVFQLRLNWMPGVFTYIENLKSSVVQFYISSPVDPLRLMELNLRTKKLTNISRGKKNLVCGSKFVRKTFKATSQDRNINGNTNTSGAAVVRSPFSLSGG